jgi:uncharacterized membrane protein YfcA
VLRLVLIGLAAGLFSALFGVGGGIVIVPLLLLFAAFEPRPATATSLAAIGIISTVGVVSYALRGEVKPGAAAIVGIPAAVGALGGTRLQQRVQGRTLTLAFAVLLAGLGIRFLV